MDSSKDSLAPIVFSGPAFREDQGVQRCGFCGMTGSNGREPHSGQDCQRFQNFGKMYQRGQLPSLPERHPDYPLKSLHDRLASGQHKPLAAEGQEEMDVASVVAIPHKARRKLRGKSRPQVKLWDVLHESDIFLNICCKFCHEAMSIPAKQVHEGICQKNPAHARPASKSGQGITIIRASRQFKCMEYGIGQ